MDTLLSSRETALIDLKTEQQVKRKIDLVVLPLICLAFFAQCLDKLTLNYASVFGLIEDLDLHGTQYSWIVSICYVGQLVSEFPAMYLISRLTVARFVACTIIVWGGICMCSAAATTYSSLMGIRFALGIAEGVVTPAYVPLISLWYKKSEHPVRVGLWYSCSGFAQVFGALIMYGVGHAQMSIAPWKAMFIICGAVSPFIGVAFFFLVPGSPETAWFLNPQERIIAKWRLEVELDGGDRTNFAPDQLKESVMDLRVYLSFVFGTLVALAGTVITFASLTIHHLGYDKFETMLYTCPSGAVQVVSVWISFILCGIWPNNRCAIAIVLTIVPLLGIILLFALPLTVGWGMVVASWLASVMSNIISILLSLNASNTRGNTKKAIVNALFCLGAAVGGICGPLLWKVENAPRYRNGLILSLCSLIGLIASVMLYWYSCIRDNRRRCTAAGLDPGNCVIGVVGDDLTDKQNRLFRYNT
ncbi:hypothetical protein FE257_006759 [Aspergillus nanangensis]|uniref:Major facilitator superfamily (MFS) profile domain-containing protein n=1 Tax=Aspergillus nanangensis TaxID=2582783 RepID=A0AAD4GUL7_ASPNN|nr:hypothetical protein FE257_006759 [Aspergillus nanangensis]